MISILFLLLQYVLPIQQTASVVYILFHSTKTSRVDKQLEMRRTSMHQLLNALNTRVALGMRKVHQTLCRMHLSEIQGLSI